MDVLRAVECGADAGAGQHHRLEPLISPEGRVLQETKINGAGLIEAWVAPRQNLTPYVVIGDVWAQLCNDHRRAAAARALRQPARGIRALAPSPQAWGRSAPRRPALRTSSLERLLGRTFDHLALAVEARLMAGAVEDLVLRLVLHLAAGVGAAVAKRDPEVALGLALRVHAVEEHCRIGAGFQVVSRVRRDVHPLGTRHRIGQLRRLGCFAQQGRQAVGAEPGQAHPGAQPAQPQHRLATADLLHFLIVSTVHSHCQLQVVVVRIRRRQPVSGSTLVQTGLVRRPVIQLAWLD